MDFTKYGLTPEQVQELTTAFNAEIAQAKAQATAPYADYESLKADLQDKNFKINTYEKDLAKSKKFTEKLTESLETINLDRAIDKAFFDKDIKDSDLFATQIDRTKISKNEQGEYIGLNEQIDGVLTKYAHLLKKEPINPLQGATPKQSEPQKTMSVEDFLSQDNFSLDKWQKFLKNNR